jgi:uncharacterized repeat protein (TIGR01451 family)
MGLYAHQQLTESSGHDRKQAGLKWIVLFVLVCVLPATGFTQENLVFQEFIIPAPETVINTEFRYLINNRTMSSNIKSIISITVDADQTVIHYDHWENGYGDIDERFTLNKGETHTFENWVNTTPRNPDYQLYDGMDRILVFGGSAFVTRANWPQYPGSLMAMASQVYPVQALDNTFSMPIGDDLAQSDDTQPFADFKAVSLLVQSMEDNNHVILEDDAGTVVYEETLNKGKCITDPIIRSMQCGYQVRADHPIQVHILTGDNELDPGYEVNGIAGIPTSYWDDEYVIPVTSFDPSSSKPNNNTDVYIYNPHDVALTINYEHNTSGSFSVPPGEIVSFREETGDYLPRDAGARLTASDVFWGFGYACTGYDQYDWAFELVGDNLLSEFYSIGWAPGDISQSNNYSAVFLTPVGSDATVYVDYEQDGVVDDTFSLSFPSVRRVVDPSDADMTGARIWSDQKLAMAYGAIAGESTPESQPSIDSGYSIIFAVEGWSDALMDLTKHTQRDSLPLTHSNVFTVGLKTFDYEVSDVVLTDQLPPGWSYDDGTTDIEIVGTGQDLSVEPTESGTITGGMTLTWTLSQPVPVSDSLALVFSATPVQDEALGVRENVATVDAIINGDPMTESDRVDIFAYPGNTIHGWIWQDDDYDGLQDASEPAIPDVSVQLLQDGTTVVVETVSDAAGEYLFERIPKGTYAVRFGGLTGYHATHPNQGTDDSIDSDADRETITTPTFSVTLEDDISDLDYGLTDEYLSDLLLTKMANATDVYQGTEFTYTLEITNNGIDPAEGIVVEDSLSTWLQLLGATPSPDGQVNNHLIWNLDPLDVDESMTIQYTVRVLEYGDDITTEACVTGTHTDPDESNNCGTASVTSLYPIELSLFEAEAVADGVRLQWQTQSETDNMGFIVFRTDSESAPYERITDTLIPGAGSSSSKQSYSYLDDSVTAGQSYLYKLADVDYSGVMTFHGPIRVEAQLPQNYCMEPNFPNPFNPETHLRIHVKEAGEAILAVYDLRGRRVRTLVNHQVEAGIHDFVWNGRDERGRDLASGVYMAVFSINGFRDHQKLSLIR